MALTPGTVVANTSLVTQWRGPICCSIIEVCLLGGCSQQGAAERDAGPGSASADAGGSETQGFALSVDSVAYGDGQLCWIGLTLRNDAIVASLGASRDYFSLRTSDQLVVGSSTDILAGTTCPASASLLPDGHLSCVVAFKLPEVSLPQSLLYDDGTHRAAALIPPHPAIGRWRGTTLVNGVQESQLSQLLVLGDDFSMSFTRVFRIADTALAYAGCTETDMEDATWGPGPSVGYPYQSERIHFDVKAMTVSRTNCPNPGDNTGPIPITDRSPDFYGWEDVYFSSDTDTIALTNSLIFGLLWFSRT
jgi:hypothetical protein